MNMRDKVKCMYFTFLLALIFLEDQSCMVFYNNASICRRAKLAEELALLRQVDEFASKGISPPRGKNGFARYEKHIKSSTIVPFPHFPF